MASYGYEGGYGYSSYGYEAYGYGYGGYSDHPIPNAAAYLTGPGSYAYINQPYARSYAYESQTGGIYTHTYIQTDTGYINSTSYSLAGDSYKITESTFYQNFTYRSGPVYGYGYGYEYGQGYYAGYGSPDLYTSSTHTQTQHYVGSYDYSDNKDFSSTEALNGYNYSSYSHITDTFLDGHLVGGSGYNYYQKSVTNPYGYSTYSSHTSTF